MVSHSLSISMLNLFIRLVIFVSNIPKLKILPSYNRKSYKYLKGSSFSRYYSEGNCPIEIASVRESPAVAGVFKY